LILQPGITTEAFKEGMAVAGRRVCAARDELCALDAAAGDGDLGATLAIGFSHLDGWLGSFDGHDLGELLVGFGAELGRSAPSTIGTLLATAFIRAGKPVAGLTEVHGSDVGALLEAAANGVAERGRAEAGQRTILDAMLAASAAADGVVARGGDAVETLRAAALGAREGATATVQMEPKHGRAGWIKDRARGLEDAGAVAWAIYLDGLADGSSIDPQLTADHDD
jgi:phosphoenolpyruvate---glycerone phosphotransferase subunit DhaL